MIIKMQYYHICLAMLLLFACSGKNNPSQNPPANNRDTVTSNSSSNLVDTVMAIEIQSSDQINLKADIYYGSDADAPMIMLFHQARYSRGEYHEIAPKLNKLGFNCIAVDQRSGKEFNGIENSAYIQANDKGLGTEYEDAYPDLVATLNYVKDSLGCETILAWGSSYSSALVFSLAAEHPEIDGILSFSPGNWFTINEKTTLEHAEQLEIPVFITSTKTEESEWRVLYNAVNSGDKAFFLPETEGKHGSSALFEVEEEHENYWNAVKEFLLKFTS